MCVFHSLFKHRYSPYTEFCRHRQAAGSLRFWVWVLQFKAPGLSVPGELVIRLLGWLGRRCYAKLLVAWTNGASSMKS